MAISRRLCTVLIHNPRRRHFLSAPSKRRPNSGSNCLHCATVLRFTTGVSVFPSDPASLSQGKDHFQAKRGVLQPATRARQHTHDVAHRASSTGPRQSYAHSFIPRSRRSTREVAERPSDRRACLVLPAVRKLALLAALCTRGARVFVRQSSETPGALESGMRRSSVGRLAQWCCSCDCADAS